MFEVNRSKSDKNLRTDTQNQQVIMVYLLKIMHTGESSQEVISTIDSILVYMFYHETCKERNGYSYLKKKTVLQVQGTGNRCTISNQGSI